MKNLTMLLALLLLLPSMASAQPDPDCYHNLDALYEAYFDLQDQFPERVKIDSIGHSQQDSLPVYLVKISNDAYTDYNRPTVLYFAQIHAEEVIGIELIYQMAEQLVTQPGGDWRQRRFQLETYIIPTFNPEGLRVVWGEGPD
ncbi:hypothetical protein GF324_04510, partial [bacterium]|nr:hypothetical protein [bacterium]